MNQNRVVTTSGTLASAVADSGTLVVTFPSRLAPQQGSYQEGDFYLAMGHKLVMGQADLDWLDDFSIDFTTSATTFTVTNQSGATWPAGTKWTLELNQSGRPFYRNPVPPDTKRIVNRVGQTNQYRLCITPDVLDADGVVASQTISATVASLDGALVAAGVAIMDVPRCLQAAWTTNATLTITGKDEYGNTVVETSAAATVSMKGSKSFANVTSVTASVTVTGATVGTTDRLGLPFFLPSKGNVRAVVADSILLPPVTRLSVSVDQTRLLAGTSCYVVTPWAGYIEAAQVVIDTTIAGTGGTLGFIVGSTTVTGLAFTVGDTAAAGSVMTDTPTAVDGYTNVTNWVSANNLAITCTGDTAFNSAGALTESLVLNTQGIFTPGFSTAAGSTATSSDVRGLFKPTIACDGSTAFELFVELPDGDDLGIAQYVP